MLNMGCIMHWMKERKIKNEVIVNIDCLFESVFFLALKTPMRTVIG